jgi:hypothetical protein
MSPNDSGYNFIMAAIDLTRLNKQIEALKQVFSQPAEFRRQFHEILQFYHRYAHRQHKDAVPVSFMRVYDLPDQILPQIANGLNLKARQNANETLAAVDELWQDEHFEARDLAAHLLGQVPLTAKADVLERFRQWSSVPLDRAVVKALFVKGIQRLRSEDPNGWTKFVGDMLNSPVERLQNHGLYALSLLIEQAHSDLFPQFFRWIRPFLQSDQSLIEANLSQVIAALAHRSPAETAYVLKEVLSDTDGSGIERRVRTYLPYFDEQLSEGLQASVRMHQKRTKLGL